MVQPASCGACLLLTHHPWPAGGSRQSVLLGPSGKAGFQEPWLRAAACQSPESGRGRGGGGRGQGVRLHDPTQQDARGQGA